MTLFSILCFAFMQSALATPEPADRPAVSTEAPLEKPRILSLVKVGNHIHLRDDTGLTWCLERDPLSLIWIKKDKTVTFSDQSLPTWRMDATLAKTALESGIDQSTLMALTGRKPLFSPPPTAVTSDFVQADPVVSRLTKQVVFSKRVGLCVGLDPTCNLIGLKLELTSHHMGLQVAGPLPQASLKVYPFPFRLYAYGGSTFVEGPANFNFGGGIGYDIHFSKSKRWILQPQIGYHFMDLVLMGSEEGQSASIALSYAFGRQPDWMK